MITKTERELKLILQIEKVRIEKIKISGECRLKELVLKKEIAEIYRNKKKAKKAKEAIEQIKQNQEKEGR